MMTESYMKLHVVAFGVALGVLTAVCMFIMGLFAMGGYGATYVGMMASIYIGYKATFLGSVLGAFWGFFEGFILGIFWGWLYNCFTHCSRCSMCGKCKSTTEDTK